MLHEQASVTEDSGDFSDDSGDFSDDIDAEETDEEPF
jgi:hypothetical protein